MSRVVKCAHIQASNAKHDGTPAEIKEAMIQKHIPLIEEAGNNGVMILCLQEIFYGPYFCAEQDIKWYQTAEPVPGPITRCLMEGLKSDAVCDNDTIKQFLPFKPLPYREAILRAMTREELEDRFGPLPATAENTKRLAGVSGGIAISTVNGKDSRPRKSRCRAPWRSPASR